MTTLMSCHQELGKKVKNKNQSKIIYKAFYRHQTMMISLMVVQFSISKAQRVENTHSALTMSKTRKKVLSCRRWNHQD